MFIKLLFIAWHVITSSGRSHKHKMVRCNDWSFMKPAPMYDQNGLEPGKPVTNCILGHDWPPTVKAGPVHWHNFTQHLLWLHSKTAAVVAKPGDLRQVRKQGTARAQTDLVQENVFKTHMRYRHQTGFTVQNLNFLKNRKFVRRNAIYHKYNSTALGKAVESVLTNEGRDTTGKCGCFRSSA